MRLIRTAIPFAILPTQFSFFTVCTILTGIRRRRNEWKNGIIWENWEFDSPIHGELFEQKLLYAFFLFSVRDVIANAYREESKLRYPSALLAIVREHATDNGLALAYATSFKKRKKKELHDRRDFLSSCGQRDMRLNVNVTQVMKEYASRKSSNSFVCEWMQWNVRWIATAPYE